MNIIKKRASVISRVVIVLISIILQIITMFLLVRLMHDYASWAYLLVEIVSVAVVFIMVNDASPFNSFWIVIILVLPVFGYCLYFMWGRKHKNSKFYRQYKKISEKGREYKRQDPAILTELTEMHPNKAQVSRYLINEGFPLYKHTAVKYFEVGEKKFDALFEDLEKAEKYIP